MPRKIGLSKKKGEMQGSKIYITKLKQLVLPYQKSAFKRKYIASPSEEKNSRTCKHSALQNKTHAESLRLRYAIYYHFTNFLDAPYQEHWQGLNGTLSLIRIALKSAFLKFVQLERH